MDKKPEHNLTWLPIGIALGAALGPLLFHSQALGVGVGFGFTLPSFLANHKK